MTGSNPSFSDKDFMRAVSGFALLGALLFAAAVMDNPEDHEPETLKNFLSWKEGNFEFRKCTDTDRVWRRKIGRRKFELVVSPPVVTKTPLLINS